MLKGRVPWPGKSFERAKERPRERNHTKNIQKVNALKCEEEYHLKNASSTFSGEFTGILQVKILTY